MSKIMVWDIETTGFKADFAHLLTVAATWVGHDKMYTWRINDTPGYGTTPESYLDDRWMVEEVVDMINESDMLVHHYGDGFDLPFINTRALAWDIPPPGHISTVDTWKISRRHLALGSNRLVTLASFLNDEDAQKGGLTKQEWRLAHHGDAKVLQKMVEYNIGDVVATEEAYLKLRPVIANHPFVARPVEGKDRNLQCRACESYDSHSEGSYYTKRMHVKRRRCNNCGHGFEESRSSVK